jgi:hypothetical protein
MHLSKIQIVIFIGVVLIFSLFIAIPILKFIHRIIFKRNICNYKLLKNAEWRLNKISFDNGMVFFYPRVKYLGVWF